MQFVKSGKVKDVYAAGEDELEFLFSDRISVFDKIIPSMIPHKGETLARTSAFWFEAAERLGVRTHYIRLTAPDRMLVKRVKVISDYSLLDTKTTGYLIPLECVVRYFVYGSLWDRVRQGAVRPEQLGFAPGHETWLAEPLPEPFFEVTTKLEKVDRNLTEEEAIRISGITPVEYAQLKEACLRIDEEINRRVKSRGLIHVDGKKEFAFGGERDLMVVDTFCTADEDRFWDAAEYERGKYVERSKEMVRQHYRNTGYYDDLMKARKEGGEEPAMPPLPDGMIAQVSSAYIRLFEDMTGQKFR